MRLPRSKYWQTAIVIAAFMASPRAAMPQSASSGSITGLVKDSSGAVVPSATVRVKNESTNIPYIVATSTTGNYGIPELPVGTYAVTVSVAGFKTWSRTNVLVSSADVVRIDAVMTVGEVAEQIVVTGGPPALQTESTQVSSDILTSTGNRAKKWKAE